MSIMSRHFPALALAGALLAGPAAFAAPADEAPSTIVRYADLDLATPAGKAELQHRLRRAATAVCPIGNPMQLETVRISRDCKAAALSRVKTTAETAIAAAEGRRHYASADTASRPAGL